jgi:hypothetical protein
MVMMMPEAYAVRLIHALDACWAAIRHQHPDVPEVVLLPTPSLPGRRAYGHFAALRWRGSDYPDEELLHEVAVVAERLDRSAEQVFETLLHEAAHARNFAAGIKDCSVSQYHNLKFRACAEDLGLEVRQTKHYGWADTSMPMTTEQLYRLEIDALASVLIHRRGRGTSKARRRSRLLKAQCQCPRIIRASRAVLDQADILCSVCGQPFVSQEPSDD